MKKYFFYLSMALVAFVVASCGLKGNHTSSGRPYELLVVVDAGVWDRAAGRALHDVLDSDMPGLPQSEPSFRIMYTSPKDYDSTLKLIRNIVIVDIKDIYTKGTFKYAKDVYASPKYPFRSPIAPVNAPFSCPNSSESIVPSGMAPQLTAIYCPCFLRLY